MIKGKIIHFRYFNKFILILSLSLLLLLSSCNIFFSAPHGRENLYDDAAQITAFTTVPSSDNSIITMWNWMEAPTWLKDDKITEIRIQHSIFGYPENLDLIFGETFKDNNTFQHEWENLTSNLTHYFSLFAKSSDDGKDIWYAPIHSKVKLPGEIKTSTHSINIAWTVDDTSVITPGVNGGSLSATSVLIIEIDVPREMKIKSAVINPSPTLGIHTLLVTPFCVYPLLRPFNENDSNIAWHEVEDQSDPSINYLIGEESGINISGTGNILNTNPLDITPAVLRAVAAGNNQIVFKMEGIPISVINLPYADFLIVKYYE